MNVNFTEALRYHFWLLWLLLGLLLLVFEFFRKDRWCLCFAVGCFVAGLVGIFSIVGGIGAGLVAGGVTAAIQKPYARRA